MDPTPQIKTSHIQGKRRSPNKVVGGMQSCLESNPIYTRDSQRPQKNPCVHQGPEIPQRLSQTCLCVFACLLQRHGSALGTGQQRHGSAVGKGQQWAWVSRGTGQHWAQVSRGMGQQWARVSSGHGSAEARVSSGHGRDRGYGCSRSGRHGTWHKPSWRRSPLAPL